MNRPRKKFKHDTAIDPNYIYPRDPMQTLVRDAGSEGGRFSYLGTICNMMRRRREDREWMSQNNFNKNHAHEKVE